MSAIPKKPSSENTKTLDDIIADQARQKGESLGVKPPVQPKPKKKASVKPPKKVLPTSKAKTKPEERKVSVAPATTKVTYGRPAASEKLKNAQYNLPIDLIERISVIAEKYHAGNRSHFVRAALEEAVSAAEKRK